MEYVKGYNLLRDTYIPIRWLQQVVQALVGVGWWLVGHSCYAMVFLSIRTRYYQTKQRHLGIQVTKRQKKL